MTHVVNHLGDSINGPTEVTPAISGGDCVLPRSKLGVGMIHTASTHRNAEPGTRVCWPDLSPAMDLPTYSYNIPGSAHGKFAGTHASV